MHVNLIISELRVLTQTLATRREEAQEQLRAHVTNKAIPLKDRFQVWIDLCDKENHSRLDVGEISPIGDWVEADLDRYDRGVDYDWDHFLDLVQEHYRDPEFSELKGDVPSVDEFKEFLIAENFGSMCYDW